MRRLKNAPPPQVLEGKRKRHASTWLTEFVKVPLPGPRLLAPVCSCYVTFVHRTAYGTLLLPMQALVSPGADAHARSA